MMMCGLWGSQSMTGCIPLFVFLSMSFVTVLKQTQAQTRDPCRKDSVFIYSDNTKWLFIQCGRGGPGLQGLWGVKEGIKHTPLSSDGSHAATHSLAGFQVGRDGSRKVLRTEASVRNRLKDNNSQILVFRLQSDWRRLLSNPVISGEALLSYVGLRIIGDQQQVWVRGGSP